MCNRLHTLNLALISSCDLSRQNSINIMHNKHHWNIVGLLSYFRVLYMLLHKIGWNATVAKREMIMLVMGPLTNVTRTALATLPTYVVDLGLCQSTGLI